MQRRSAGAIGAAALLAPGFAGADTGGAGGWMIIGLIYYACILYLILCAFSIPISLLLTGSKLKRIAIGFVVPLVGIGLGEAIEIWLYRTQLLYYVGNDGGPVVIVVSSVPVVLLLVWALVSRARAHELERSRVRYSEYLEREKALEKLAATNSQRVKP